MQHYAEYNKDESGIIGYAEEYFFPQNEEELLEIIQKAHANNIKLTFQGGKTGIAGASVPFGGWLINLAKLSSIIKIENDSVEVEAGITLKYLNQYIRQHSKNLFFPINPTEELATIGGIIATNARALNAMKYGFMEDYISEITVINLDGTKEVLKKGNTKIQQVIASEGKTCVISKVALSLLPKPNIIWGISFFFEEEKNAFSFIEALKPLHEILSAIEFIDKKSIELIEEKKQLSEKIKKIPTIDSSFQALVYIEIEKNTEEEIEECVEQLIEVGAENNTDSDNAWIFEGYEEVQRMRDFRHAILEFLLQNKNIFGFNLQANNKNYGELVELVKSTLPSSNSYFFGHAENDTIFCMLVEDNTNNMQEKLSKLEELFDKIYLEEDTSFISDYGIGEKNKIFFEKYSAKKA